MSASSIQTIAKLPSREERLHALKQTGLVRKFEEGDWWDGLLIWSGEISPPSPDDWITPFPFELLEDSGSEVVTAEVWEVIFGANRVILGGELDKGLAFLKTHQKHVKYIRTLDVNFSERYAIGRWLSEPIAKVVGELFKFIATELDVEHLELTLDASICREDYLEMGFILENEKEELKGIVPVYKEIVNMLDEALAGKKPKTFLIFWAVFYHMESEGEKQIMGQNYDSAELGKIPPPTRNIYKPHGPPEQER